MQWYGPEEACKVIQDADGLLLVGDSLMRGIVIALITVLSGDYETATYGKLQGDTFVYPYCPIKSIGNLITSSKLSEGTAALLKAAGQNAGVSPARGLREIRHHKPDFCPSWDAVYIKWFPDSEPVQDSRMAEDDAGMLQQVDVDAATVVVNGGLHFRQMNVGVLERVFHHPEFKNVSRLVCMTVHAPSSNKPAQYLERQGLAPTQVFNDIMRNGACLGRNDFVLESFAVTRNATSIDGTHYYHEPMAKRADTDSGFTVHLFIHTY